MSEEKKYMYCVQWIDHGGPYHEPSWESEVPTALRQMGFNPDETILEMGGVRLADPFSPDFDLFGYIVTNAEMPRWVGFEANRKQYVEDIRLWFHAFQVEEDDVLEKYDLFDFEHVFYAY